MTKLVTLARLEVSQRSRSGSLTRSAEQVPGISGDEHDERHGGGSGDELPHNGSSTVRRALHLQQQQLPSEQRAELLPPDLLTETMSVERASPENVAEELDSRQSILRSGSGLKMPQHGSDG